MAGSSLRSLCLLFLSAAVCLATIEVTVSPMVDVIKGETVRLPCTFKNSDPNTQVSVQWSIDSAGTRKRIAYSSKASTGIDKDTAFTGRISIEGDYTLVISHTTVDDQMSFFCQVNGGPIGVSEKETKLRVFYAPEKPVVSGNNQIITVNDGTSEVGTCTSRNGHPEPRIIWFKDALPLPEVTDSREKTYMVPKVVKESSGLFTVTSTLYMMVNKNDAKSDFHCTVEYRMPNDQIKKESSDNFKLSINYPAENVFFKLLSQKPIKEGDEVRMSCETDGNPQPQIDFYKDTKALKGENGLLTLTKVTRNDSGAYKCEALDFDALEFDVELTKFLTINVHYLDPLSIEPVGPLVVSEGESLDVQCKTKSSDKFTVVWMKGGETLSQSGTLSMHSITLANAGEYVCVASVPSVPGLENRANITVRVKGKPVIDQPVKGMVSKEGEIVTLRCSAQGYPSPQFSWKPTGKESVTVEGQKTISTLTLPAIAAVLKEGVTCEATNEFGSDSKKIQVEIKSDNTVDANNEGRADTQQGGSSGVVIAVVVCVLLLLLLVALLYFLSKKGKMACGKKDKEVSTGQVNITMDPKPTENSELLNKPTNPKE